MKTTTDDVEIIKDYTDNSKQVEVFDGSTQTTCRYFISPSGAVQSLDGTDSTRKRNILYSWMGDWGKRYRRESK